MIFERKYDLSTQSGRALKLLDDPKWSFNKFPQKQINAIRFFIRSPRRSIRLYWHNFTRRLLGKTL